MIRAIAKIKSIRSQPIFSGYRPLCSIVGQNTSGQVELLEQEVLNVGEEAIVRMTFVSESLLVPDFKVGCLFSMSEGRHVVGFGEILEVCGKWEGFK
jgi:translation elongation factor EF-Tu-like GTPase